MKFEPVYPSLGYDLAKEFADCLNGNEVSPLGDHLEEVDVERSAQKRTVLHHVLESIWHATRPQITQSEDLVTDNKRQILVAIKQGAIKAPRWITEEKLDAVSDGNDQLTDKQWASFTKCVDQLRKIEVEAAFFLIFHNRALLFQFSEKLAEYVGGIGLRVRRQAPPSWVKHAIFYRDRGRCRICNAQVENFYNTHYDHVVALATGGTNDVTNFQLLCSRCNLKKGSKRVINRTEPALW